MNNKRKFLIIITILLVILSVSVITYAFFAAKEIYGGTFDVDITSKGVDTFDLKASNDITFFADSNNFAYMTGKDISGSAYIDVSLNTSKRSSTYCYEVTFKMPDKEVFNYSNYPNPELVLDVEKIEGDKTTSLIRKLDVTKGIGSLRVPTELNTDNYLHKITASQNENKQVRYQATLTLVYFPDINQNINQYKRYDSSIKVDIAPCE